VSAAPPSAWRALCMLLVTPRRTVFDVDAHGGGGHLEEERVERERGGEGRRRGTRSCVDARASRSQSESGCRLSLSKTTQYANDIAYNMLM
jgi:hypothetical protein